MVLHGRVLREVGRYATRYFPRTIQAIQRQDVRIHKSLYGASGGRGVRHGRDIGAAAGGIYQQYTGETLDDVLQEPEDGQGISPKASYKYKTYSRYKRKRTGCRPFSKRYNQSNR